MNAYLGWFGPASRAMQGFSAGTSLAMKVPGVEELWDAAGERFVQGSTGGPDAEARSKSGSHIVGHRLRRRRAAQLSEVHLKGIDGYTFTGRMLAWAADRAAGGGAEGHRARSARWTRSGSTSSWRAAQRRASRRRARRVRAQPTGRVGAGAR